ncbi:MAG: replication protein RepA [Chloroflexota bacterium]|nr:replication protein RepA [Chloroflexota bacterium]
MERKRGGLVPIGGAISDLRGPLKEIRDATPQALHHFTRFDQVNQLVGAGEADPDMGFMARLLALCSLPRTNPGDRLRYVRRNGPYTLVMNAGGLHKLPYGNLPRLLLAWLCTEAVQTQSRELILGASLAEFMRKLSINSDSGGSRGERTRLRNQMRRLFNANIRLVYEDEHGEQFVASNIADRGELWWDPRRPDEPVLWESKIYLGEAFFYEIISHPVPLDMNILKALKRSSLGLDLYLWLTYRTFALARPLRLSWRQLYRQFGASPANANEKYIVRNFRTKCLRELKKIKAAWPELNYATAKGVLILLPSEPAVPRLQLVE